MGHLSWMEGGTSLLALHIPSFCTKCFFWCGWLVLQQGWEMLKSPTGLCRYSELLDSRYQTPLCCWMPSLGRWARIWIIWSTRTVSLLKYASRYPCSVSCKAEFKVVGSARGACLGIQSSFWLAKTSLSPLAVCVLSGLLWAFPQVLLRGERAAPGGPAGKLVLPSLQVLPRVWETAPGHQGTPKPPGDPAGIPRTAPRAPLAPELSSWACTGEQGSAVSARAPLCAGENASWVASFAASSSCPKWGIQHKTKMSRILHPFEGSLFQCFFPLFL